MFIVTTEENWETSTSSAHFLFLGNFELWKDHIVRLRPNETFGNQTFSGQIHHWCVTTSTDPTPRHYPCATAVGSYCQVIHRNESNEKRRNHRHPVVSTHCFLAIMDQFWGEVATKGRTLPRSTTSCHVGLFSLWGCATAVGSFLAMRPVNAPSSITAMLLW